MRIRILLIIIITLGLASCFNKISDFYVSKLPLVEPSREIPLKLNGVYISREKYGSVFYLFKDGSCKWAGWGTSCCPTEPVKIETIENDWLFTTKKVHWGQYAIIGDSIIIQDFSKNNQEFFNHWIIEHKGRILNDTTFEIFSSYSYLGKDTLSKESKLYRFYPTAIKPDSSKTWFAGRNWFKKSLHESRK